MLENQFKIARMSIVLSVIAALAACGGGTSADPESTLPTALSAQQSDGTLSELRTTAGTSNVADPVVSTAQEEEAVQAMQSFQATLGASTSSDTVLAAATQTSTDASLQSTAPLPYRTTSSTVTPPGVLRWSDPNTWGGRLPGAGAAVIVPAGKTILLDTDTASLGALSVEGTLQFDDKDVSLTAASIKVTGSFLIGSTALPFANKATITLTGAPQAVNNGVSRGINVVGGRFEIHAISPSPVWTKLNDHVDVGSTSFWTEDPTNWRAGDTIAVAPTDYYGTSQTERFTVTEATGHHFATSAGLKAFRWGKLQYVTSSGMSLTPQAGYAPPVTPAPTVLDERAAVGNLSRRVVIQSIDDDAWRTSGFGVHLMIMDLKSKVFIDGIEVRRAGQSGALGRYPIHWHMLSYSTDGTLLGDATGHVVRNSTVWNSANRCIVLHGTNGVLVQNNICEDIKGHAFFLEDAVERRNVFEGNLALMMRVPPAGKKLQVHEGEVTQGGPAGFWLTNPDNVVRDNHAGDAQGNGFWMSFPRKALGLSAKVPILPDRLPHGIFENNTGHSSRGPGVLLAWVPVDAAGNLTFNKYIPTVDGSEDKGSNRVRFTLKHITSFKNLEGAYRNSVSAPDYVEWVTADNVGTHFAGAGDDGLIARGLIIGTSLNNRSAYPKTYLNEPPAAFATYHSTFRMRDNTVVNFPFVEGKPSGAFRTTDYYLSGVDKGLHRNTDNRLIASHPGFRTLPPNMDGQPLNNRNWTLSGALWDANGYWGPAKNYWVYDVPFLTAGANCRWVEPAGKNGKSCDGEYYGVGNFQTDFDTNRFTFKAPLDVERLDGQGNEVGRWTVPDGATSSSLGNMRHFAARPGGTYVLRFPGKPLPKMFAMNVGNAYRSTDSFLLAISFDGNTPVSGYTIAGDNFNRDKPKLLATSLSATTVTAMGGALPPSLQLVNVRWFKQAYSLSEVASSAGDKMWQDKANNLVWIRIHGGMYFPNEQSLVPGSDTDLYRAYSVLLYPR